MADTPTYTAITIGPIYKTLDYTRKTRELWGASYLISYIMRRLCESIEDKSKCCLPYHPNILTKCKGTGTGLFPDRLIYEGDIKQEIENASVKIIEEIASNSGMDLDYLKNYLRVSTVTFSLPTKVDSNNENEINNNIVLVANKLLDTIELKEKHYTGDIDKVDWRKSIDKINGKLFYNEAFNKEDKDRFIFPSIIEIATQDFAKANPSEYQALANEFLRNFKSEGEENDRQKEFIEALRNDSRNGVPDKFKPVKWRPYHKYIAVVQADGDNVGKTISKIGDNPKMVRVFSAALFDFALKACKVIEEYGGKAVYVGGDDLFFFAPVAVNKINQENPSLKTVFALINDLDTLFENEVIKNTALAHLYENGGVLENDKPTMSYGLSITYSKYPLNEAKDNAYQLLREIKQLKEPERKNRINFKLHKHSGQGFGFMIEKSIEGDDKQSGKIVQTPTSFKYFLDMVTNIPLEEGTVSSVIYKLSPLHALLQTIGRNKRKLTDFFDQEFELEGLRKRRNENKLYGADKVKLDFLDSIIDYFHQLCEDFKDDNQPLPAMETEQPKSNIAKLYSTLRFMKHLTDDDNE